jgi:hypothetical protein
MDGNTNLTGARPPAAPVRMGAGQGAGEREGSAGDPFRASPKVGRRRGGRAMAVKVAAGRTPVQGCSGLRIRARRSGGEVVGGGERAATVVRHDGGGGSCFRMGSIEAVLRPFQEQKGGTGRWWRPFFQGRKMTGRGPRVGERGRGGLSGLAKG